MRGLMQRYGLSVILGGICFVFGMMVLLEWQLARGAREARAGRLQTIEAVPETNETAAVSEFSLPEEGHYTALLMRPLFTEGRRPSPEPEAGSTEATNQDQSAPPPTPSLPPPNVRLTGTLITPSQTIALLRDNASGKVERVPVGGEVAGWRLEKVLEDKVVFTLGGQVHEVPLRLEEEQGAKSGATPPPPSPLAPGRPQNRGGGRPQSTPSPQPQARSQTQLLEEYKGRLSPGAEARMRRNIERRNRALGILPEGEEGKGNGGASAE